MAHICRALRYSVVTRATSDRQCRNLFDFLTKMPIVTTTVRGSVATAAKIVSPTETPEYHRHPFYKLAGGSIDLTKDDTTGIATLCLNNPTKKNGLSGRMMLQMSDVIGELEKWEEGKAVIIYGVGKFFCSGGDLTTVKKIADTKNARVMSNIMQKNFERLESMNLLTVALIQGKAIGGGSEIITACDFRVMTPEAEIGYVHVKMGIAPAWGGATRLAKIVGYTQALELITSGRLVNAKEACKLNLVNHILELENNDTDCAVKETIQWLKKYTFSSSRLLSSLKAMINGAKKLPFAEALEEENDIHTSLWGGPDHQVALLKNMKHRT